MEVIVKQVGVIQFKNKSYPWRVLLDNQLQVFVEEKSHWENIINFNLSAVVK
jgi:hypothetical protein